MKKWLVILSFILASGPLRSASTSPVHPNEVVVLLHGILNKPIFMKRIENAFTDQGYEVINWGYPSTEGSIADHAKNLDKVMKEIKPDKKIHIVAFSLGAILARYYLHHYRLTKVGRFVMIAPPNHGSEMVDKLYPKPWFRWIYGDEAIEQLRASQSDALNKECGIPSCPFGIIAGGFKNGKGLNRLLKGDNDGTVTVKSAKLKGAKDFIILPHEHTALLFAEETSKNAVSFIQTGKFIKK